MLVSFPIRERERSVAAAICLEQRLLKLSLTLSVVLETEQRWLEGAGAKDFERKDAGRL